MTQTNKTDVPSNATNHMYSAVNNPIKPDSATVTIHPQARLNPPTEFSRYAGADYIPFIVTKTRENKWLVCAEDEFETISETFPTKKSAIGYAGDIYNDSEFKYKYAVIKEGDTITDIYHGKAWMEYRVLKSNVDGWVHGFHGDAEYQKGGTKKKIIEGAKERVVERGYNRLLIEDRNGEVVDIWPNCFLAMP